MVDIMRAGIITITNGTDNYGNVLQQYAVQQSLKQLEIDSEIIRNYSFAEYRCTKLYLLPKIILNYKAGMKSIKFARFIQKYIRESKEIITSQTIPEKIKDKYDFYICGSDQIWNPYFKQNGMWDVMFLKFAQEKRKVALAASFGVDTIPQTHEEIFKEGIENIDFLSVREEAGKKIVEKLTGKEAQVIIDPTLSLSREEWLKVAKKPKKISENEKYVLMYFLGNVIEEYKKQIQEWAQELEYTIIDLMDLSSTKSFALNPGEFIWLIANCKLMCTDSYHGSVFSMINEVPFVVFQRIENREDMNSRIVTLVNKFGLEKQVYNAAQTELMHYISCDYSESAKILKEERKKYIDFLENACKEL